MTKKNVKSKQNAEIPASVPVAPWRPSAKTLWLSLAFVLFAGLLRFLLLDNKPVHFDESINMWFVKRIWEEGFFTYDPSNYHGPLFFYLVHFANLFLGFDVISTRWVASIFSFLTLVILWFGPVGQRRALRWAALFLLMSPAMGFYGRSGIHESVFVFFQVLGFLSFHYFVIRDYKRFWWLFGAGLFGMMALKETFLILILAFLPAATACWFLARRQFPLEKTYQELKTSFQLEAVYVPLLMMFLFFVGLFAGFGGNPKGMVDFFVAITPWLKTGVHGAGHEKPFIHWTKLMWENEWAILFGFAVSLAFVRKNRWILFYGITALTSWLIYSLIPYKTPWCLISILWPFGILAGFGFDEVWQRFPKVPLRAGVVAVLLGLFTFESMQMYKVEYRDPIDMDHPFVYVNSTYQMKEFIAKVQGMLAANPLLREQTVQIGAEESWPFPIVFAKIYNLNYQKYGIEVAEGAMIYIVDPQDQKMFEAKLEPHKAEYATFLLETRQGRARTYIYVKKDLFQNVFSWPLSEVGTL
jgi:uncharacterized protein (TIGR03663 family)